VTATRRCCGAALGELERLDEEPDRGRDAREHVAADAQAVQHLSAVDVGELGALDEPARLGEQEERALEITGVGASHRLAVQRADVKLDGACAEHDRQRPGVGGDRIVEEVIGEERVGTRQDRLGFGALVGGDAAGEEAGIDPEAGPEPLDRLRGGARLAALDLGDVLLREAVAREIGLRESCGDAKLAQPLTKTGRAQRSRTHSCGARRHVTTYYRDASPESNPLNVTGPKKGFQAWYLAVK
jgi:hypothetical protein